MSKKEFDLSIEETNKLYNQAILDSDLYLQSIGLGRKPKRPVANDGKFFDGYLPVGIHNASLSEIKEVIVLMTSYAEYVQSLTVSVEAEKDSAYEKLKAAKAKIRLSKTGTAAAKDDATIDDPEYKLANAEYLSKSRSYKKVVAIEESARRNIKTLSRLISTEEINNETAKRVHSVKNQNGISRGKRRWK